MEKEANEVDYNSFKGTFEELFLNDSIIIDEAEMKKYSESWKKPKVYYDIEKSEEKDCSVIDRIKEEFLRIKEVVGHRPSRVEFFNNIDDKVCFSYDMTS